jgi:hypothetical protein
MNIVKRKSATKKMKGGKESEGATGMPAQFYGSKMPSKVSSASSVQPNDSAVQNLAPYKVGGKKKAAPKKKPVTKKPVTKKTATKKTATKKPATKKPSTKKPSTKKKGGSDSPINLPALFDIAKNMKGFPGLSGDSNETSALDSIPKVGGKKSSSKKKPVVKKPVKKVAPKKKPATKKPVAKKPVAKKPVKKTAPKKKSSSKKTVKK